MAQRSRLGFHPSLGIPPYGRSRIMAFVIVLAVLMLANAAPAGPTGGRAHAQTPDSSIEYAENGTSPVAVFSAHDQDEDPIEWSLSGPDEDVFTIDGGVLAFRDPPDYEERPSGCGERESIQGDRRGVGRRSRRGSHRHRCGRGWCGEHQQIAAAGRPASLCQPCWTRMMVCRTRAGNGQGPGTGRPGRISRERRRRRGVRRRTTWTCTCAPW